MTEGPEDRETERQEDRRSSAWHIAHSESSLGWGGQEMRVMAELLGFRGRGHPVSLIAPRHSCIYREAEKEGLPVLHLDTCKSRYPLTAYRLAGWLEKNKVDILNTHSSRDGWVAAAAARMAGTPLLIRSRHIDVDYSNPFISRHAFTTLADHVLTTSDKITNHLTSTLDLPPSRIDTVSTGIDIEKFSPGGPAASLSENGDSGAPLVGMVSVLRSWKGHTDFFDAIRLLHDSGFRARYVVVGDGPVADWLKELAAELPAAARPHFAGHRDDVPEVLRALDLLLIPSVKHEGVPQIGMQALASGTPIVGTNVGGIPEIVRDGETGRIVPPEDPPALAAAIRTALEEKEATTAMSKAGRDQAERIHSLDHMLDRLVEIYSRHLSEKA